MTQKKWLSLLLKKNPKAIIVGSLGTISYDMRNIEHDNKVLLPGAMGCAMGLGLGLALNSKKKVIVVIGDGSYNMKAGSVSTIMRYRPRNLFVYVIQNNKYASTGGQKISQVNPLPPKSHFGILKLS